MYIKSYKSYIREFFSLEYGWRGEFAEIIKSISDKYPDDIIANNLKNIRNINDDIKFCNENDKILVNNIKINIGRYINSILSKKVNYKPSDLETFVNRFKSIRDKDIKSKNIEVVSGKDIVYWYSEENYSHLAINYGTLGKSCLKSKDLGYRLELYVENPEVCKLVIQKDKDDKLLSRGILWKTNKGYYLDRIYYVHPSDIFLMKDWVENRYGKLCNISENLQVKIKRKKYNSFPYMDTFKYYSNSKIYNYKPYKLPLFSVKEI